MKKVVLNIGLNVVAEEPQQQLSRTLICILGYFALTNVRVEEIGVYKEGEERTLVAYFQTSSEENLVEALTYWCRDLKQEAIAYKVNGVGAIAFNTNYTGEKFPFDQKYFKD